MTTTTELDLLGLVRRAIADPGSVLPREDSETVPNWSARAVLAVLESSEVMADVEDALGYVIETSEHDTSRFQRAHRALFPNAPTETDDE